VAIIAKFSASNSPAEQSYLSDKVKSAHNKVHSMGIRQRLDLRVYNLQNDYFFVILKKRSLLGQTCKISGLIYKLKYSFWVFFWPKNESF
jgi:hypothetical protein